jgi:hypothetical protein
MNANDYSGAMHLTAAQPRRAIERAPNTLEYGPISAARTVHKSKVNLTVG